MSTMSTRLSTMRKAKRKLMSALFSTIGKKRGMMTEVTQLAMRIYTVIDSMLPPSFSVITGAAAAVGQMKQMNMPSKMSFQPGEGAMATSATQMAESATRIPCKMKCHVRGRNSLTCILQKVT